jgi:outer membrane biosynthesis protein TonB
MSDDDLRRRRRLTSGGPRRSSGGGNSFVPWVVTVLAAIAVIAGGWFLGQTLARVFNGSQSSTQVAQKPTPLSVTPLPSASPTESAATAAPSPTVTPAPTEAPTPSPTVAPTKAPVVAKIATPSVVPTAAPTSPPTPSPSATPVAETRKTQPIARRAESTASPAASPAAQENAASRTVRAYIDALRRGDPASAAAYLGNGVPDESFIDGSTRIANISSTQNSDGSYKVEVDMKTSQGEYYETFIVASTGNGARILDKTAIKP